MKTSAMPEARVVIMITSLVWNLVLASVYARGSNSSSGHWQTLSGNPPAVIARGGFSGLFPDSSNAAYDFALSSSAPDVILWCDVQLTRDGVGICAPDLTLGNFTDISSRSEQREKTYTVNGVPTTGWFSTDFTLRDLENVSLHQGLDYRSEKFNGISNILTIKEVADFKPPGLWLNVQHDLFFLQHNLSMRGAVLSASREIGVHYISSPEIGFLQSIAATFTASKAKLIFSFSAWNDTEPSTKQTYASLLSNLTFLKTFATGILVPKSYIWPVDDSNYVQQHTSVVLDAHRAGLEVFASGFSNDYVIGYNYSYDPLSEYLSYIDNGDFSVDGVVSDFPITPSAAIGCYTHLPKKKAAQARPLVISNGGASGDYPACTDLAYSKAISDGAEIIDCPVQISKDGIPFCMSAIDLMNSTSVVQSNFSRLATNAPEIQSGFGIFSFTLTWSQIQTLTPEIAKPSPTLFRNPRSRSAGKYISLREFLRMMVSADSVSGVLISIEYAPYLVEKHGLDVISSVLDVLGEADNSNRTDQRVMIQSTDASVLMKIKEKAKNYELVYEVDEIIRDATNSTIQDVKEVADAVVVQKSSVFPRNHAFLLGASSLVPKLQAFGLPVYVKLFSNEFTFQAWDFLSDPTVEINTFVTAANVDGVITDFPKTAATYKRNRCLGLKDPPHYMYPVRPGGLMEVIPSDKLPPAEAPSPVLVESDIAEPPLPELPVRGRAAIPSFGPTAVGPAQPSGQPKLDELNYVLPATITVAFMHLLGA